MSAVGQAGVWAGALVLTSIVGAAAVVVVPALLGRAIDAIVSGSSSAMWLATTAVVVAVLVASETVMDFASGYATARGIGWLRHGLVSRLLTMGVRPAARFASGDLVGRLVANTEEAGGSGPKVVAAAANLIPSLGGVVALALIDYWLLLTFLIAVPLFIVVLRAFSQEASSMATGYLEVQGRIATRLIDAVSGARTVAAAGSVEREVRRILEPLPLLRRYGMGMWRAHIRIAAQDILLVSLVEILVLGMAGWELSRGQISIGGMVAATQYVLLAATFGPAITIVAQLARGRAAAQRVLDVLRNAPQPYGSQALPSGRGRLEFRRVSVRRDARTVLEDINLVIPAGALVGVVGPSGAGTSTFAALIGRLIDPDRGAILLDGVPLPMLPRSVLRREVAYAFERPALIGETLSEVIAFGREIAEEDLVSAAVASRADDFIRRLPLGYRTRVVDAPLSGGELQRLGLARAFAQVGRVLVLDDVAASLDTVTELHVSKVLTTAMSDRTRIIVTHRSSTAAGLDFVVWIHDGRIRAVGPHRELWEDRTYRALFQPQEARPRTRDRPEVTRAH